MISIISNFSLNVILFSGSTFSPGAYSDAIIFEAQCEKEKFVDAVKFMSDVINHPHFTGRSARVMGPSALEFVQFVYVCQLDMLSLNSSKYYSDRTMRPHHLIDHEISFF